MMVTIKHRRFNRRVTIQKVTETANSYGEMIESWALYAKVWAQILPMNGREFFEASQEQEEQQLRIFTRYSNSMAKVTPQKYRITYDNVTYDILSVIDRNFDERLIEMPVKVRNG